MIAGAIPQEYIKFLGFVPIVLGIKSWFDGRNHENVAEEMSETADGAEYATEEADDSKKSGQTVSRNAHKAERTGGLLWSSAAVTVTNGADNIGVYVPLFAGYSGAQMMIVDGNDAIHLYEKYGFRMNAHLLWYTVD